MNKNELVPEINKSTLYVDMDGVLSDFEKNTVYDTSGSTNFSMYKHAILKDKLFENLPLMPRANDTIKILMQLQNSGAIIKILSSMGSGTDQPLFYEVYAQKIKWLARKEIMFPLIPTKTMRDKLKIINIKHDIVIDDNVGLITQLKRKYISYMNAVSLSNSAVTCKKFILYSNKTHDTCMTDLIISHIKPT